MTLVVFSPFLQRDMGFTGEEMIACLDHFETEVRHFHRCLDDLVVKTL
jgi:hypothetical protein